jgi:hypothetical protein
MNKFSARFGYLLAFISFSGLTFFFILFEHEKSNSETAKQAISGFANAIIELQGKYKELEINKSQVESELRVCSLNLSNCESKTKSQTSLSNVQNLNRQINLDDASSINNMREESISMRIDARINAITKFVPLNDTQKTRLRSKYEVEFRAKNPLETTTEKLEDILGSDSARFYREQKQKAFERARDESLERDVLYISRLLGLDPVTEENVRKTYKEVDNEMKNYAQSSLSTNNKQSRLKLLLDSEKQRNTLLTEKLKNIITNEQYQQFIEYQAQSSSQDLQLWHGKE